MTRALRIAAGLLICGLLAISLYYFYWNNRSDILIADRMSEFIDAVDQHPAPHKSKLIAFDLDDTIFMSSQLLGTPTWFYNMVNLMRQSGAAKYEAYSVVSRIDKIVQEQIPIVVVEQATLSAIRTWQKLGATVIGLTSRPADLTHITKTQLQQIGLTFTSPYFTCVEQNWHGKDGSFTEGILFLGEYLSKAELFDQFYHQIKSCGLEVDLIAQADDQQRYVTDLANLAAKNRVDFIGIIYGGALSTRNFNLLEAKNQLLDLELNLNASIIPDEYRQIFAGNS